MQGIRDVYFFTDVLLEEFQTHPGNHGKTSEFEPVLGKDSAVPRFTCVQITKRTMLCVRSFTSLIATILQRMIKIDTTGNSRDVGQQIVVVAHPRIETLCVIGPQLN
jgi:hypothetical protein